MAFEKGHKKVGGRKKGTPNKTTVAVKTALQEAFAEIGGVDQLVAWGRENPTEFYKLWVKVLSTETQTVNEHIITGFEVISVD